MNWPIYHLGECVQVDWGNTSITKKSYVDEGFLAFSAAGQDGLLPHYEHEGDGIVVSAIGARCGKCFYTTGKWTAIKNTLVIKPKPEVEISIKYLYYLLNDEGFWPKRGGGQPFITMGDARNIKISLPSLSEQERIVRLLDEAESLRVTRERANVRMEQFVPALFQEMFGDPATNPKKWKTIKLGEKISFMTSGSRGWAKHYSKSGDLFLRIQNVGMNQLLLDDVAYVQAPDTLESKRTKLQSGDLLISATADLGRTGVIPENFPVAYINQHLFILRLIDFDPYYVASYISSPSGRAQILRSNREGVKAGLNFNDIKTFDIFLPPLALQREFAVRVGEARGVQSAQGKSAEKIEALYQSMLSRAFAGEL
jgi:type I restriction enzyme S subunit